VYLYQYAACPYSWMRSSPVATVQLTFVSACFLVLEVDLSPFVELHYFSPLNAFTAMGHGDRGWHHTQTQALRDLEKRTTRSSGDVGAYRG
jgi:hypothetical protein